MENHVQITRTMQNLNNLESVGYDEMENHTKSPILEAVHETARGLYEVGAIDKVTMREYDQLCLQPVEPLAPEQIKQIREDAHVSQAIFASILNTSVSTVQKWEIGQKRPTGAALKLLHLVQKQGLENVM